MANKQRGEVNIKIGDKEFVMRPTFEALCDIEDRVGMGIPELIMRLTAGDVRLKYVLPVIHAGITAYNKDNGIQPTPSYKELGEMVVNTSFRETVMSSPVNSPVAEFLLKGINGGRIVDAKASDGKKKPEVGEETEAGETPPET